MRVYNAPPYIEILHCGLLNVIEKTEVQGQPMAAQSEIRKNQREAEIFGKWERAVTDVEVITWLVHLYIEIIKLL